MTNYKTKFYEFRIISIASVEYRSASLFESLLDDKNVDDKIACVTNNDDTQDETVEGSHHESSNEDDENKEMGSILNSGGGPAGQRKLGQEIMTSFKKAIYTNV